MDRFHIPTVAEGLIAYAIERQNGFGRHLVGTSCISLTPPQAAGFAHSAAPPLPIEPASLGFDGGPDKGFPPWAERRRLWTDAILQGMAKLDGEAPDPKLMERYDHEMGTSRRGFVTVNGPRFSNYFFEKRGSSFVQSIATPGFQGFYRINGVF